MEVSGQLQATAAYLEEKYPLSPLHYRRESATTPEPIRALRRKEMPGIELSSPVRFLGRPATAYSVE